MLVILSVGGKKKKKAINFPWLTFTYQNNFTVYLYLVYMCVFATTHNFNSEGIKYFLYFCYEHVLLNTQKGIFSDNDLSI